MSSASTPSCRLLASCLAWLLVVLALPCLARSAATSSDKPTHDGLRKLTAANFTLTNEGAWLIEFFSPKCVHCQRFGATWSELSQNKDYLRTQYPHAPFTLAQVDCIAQWDLCKEQGVTFLPRLTIYQDGKQNAEEYKGDRNYPEISAYIDKFAIEFRHAKGVADLPIVAPEDANAKPADSSSTSSDAPAATSAQHQAATPAVPAATTSHPAADTAAASLSAVDNVASPTSSSAVQPIEQVLPSGPNPKGELIRFGSEPIKTDEQLAAWLDKSSGQGPTFVKFFAPWCPHCKAMAAAYKRLSESLKGRVNAIEVDCDANRVLCGSYDIRGYPVLRLYHHGNVKEYNGGRNHDSMLKWVLKAVSSSGLKPVASNTELASLARDNEVLFLYLHSPGTPTDEVQAVEAASQVLFGRQSPIFVSSDPWLLDRYASSLAQDPASSVPAKSGLLVFKDHSVAQPVNVLNPTTLRSSKHVSAEQVQSQLARFLSREQYALVTQLTAANFEEIIRNDEDALVVLAALSDSYHSSQKTNTLSEATALKEAEISALRSTALEWRSKKASVSTRQVVFAWIDADRWKSPLRRLYGIDATKVPAAVLVDGRKLQYYALGSVSGSDVESGPYGRWIDDAVFGEIDSAVQGRSIPRSSRSLLQKSVRGAGTYMNALIETCVAHPIVAFGFAFTALGALFFYLGRTSTGTGSALPLYSKVSMVKAD